jgi:hypothetical protein
LGRTFGKKTKKGEEKKERGVVKGRKQKNKRKSDWKE